MLQTQLLPELTPNCDHISKALLNVPSPLQRVGHRRLTAVAALTSLDGYYLPEYLSAI